jgi:small subunit ribosomal protein S3
MGQKVHPKSVRLGVIYPNWDSNWIADKRQYKVHVKEDFLIRRTLKDRLRSAALSKVEIDRKAQKLIIRLISGRPGVVVGRGGQGLDAIRKELQALTGRKEIQLDVLEVARIDMDSQLVAESIAQQLEKRAAYRRTMKQAIQRAMRSGAKGIKVMVSGRLGGAEIARTEWAKEGRIPLHTFRADIDYGFAEAKTVFGIIGVKVWVFKGEVLRGDSATPNVKPKGSPQEDAEGRGNALHGGPGRPGRRDGNRGPGGPGDGRRGRGRDGGGGRREDRRSGPVTVVAAETTVPSPEAAPPGPIAE